MASTLSAVSFRKDLSQTKKKKLSSVFKTQHEEDVRPSYQKKIGGQGAADERTGANVHSGAHDYTVSR